MHLPMALRRSRSGSPPSSSRDIGKGIHRHALVLVDADAQDGTEIMFDDVFYDAGTVLLEDCYNSATGIFQYSFSAFKLLPFEDGINLTDCSVDTEPTSFSQLKSLYR